MELGSKYKSDSRTFKVSACPPTVCSSFRYSHILACLCLMPMPLPVTFKDALESTV